MKHSGIKNIKLRHDLKTMKSAGLSISKIAKELNISYKHAKQIYEQE